MLGPEAELEGMESSNELLTRDRFIEVMEARLEAAAPKVRA